MERLSVKVNALIVCMRCLLIFSKKANEEKRLHQLRSLRKANNKKELAAEILLSLLKQDSKN
jgi:hypothetical protein